MSGFPVAQTLGVIITGGLGVTIGSVGAAVIQAFTRRSENRAHAADMVADAAGNLADRLTKLNDELEGENRQMRNALLLLTDVVDQIIPLVNAPPSTIAQLKKANNAAKLSV